MEKKGSRKIGRYFVITLTVLGMLVYFFAPSVNATMNNILKMFVSGDFIVVRQFIEPHGVYAILVSFLLMALQSIATPLFAFLFILASTNLPGRREGAILSQSNAIVGAAIHFYTARLLGRDAVEKLTSRTSLEQIDEFFEKHRRLSIPIARLLPFISFDTVSYAAGLTSIPSGSFFIATGIGQFPATTIYSYVGGMLTGGTKMFVAALLLSFALSALIVSFRQLYVEKRKQKNLDKSVDITNNI